MPIKKLTMPKKKKKNRPPVSEKVKKAQQYNDFKRRLMNIAIACNASEAFKLIPEYEFKVMYQVKAKPFRVEPKNGENTKSAVTKLLREFAVRFLVNHKLTIVENGPEVSLYEYLSIAQSFNFYINSIKEGDYKGVSEIKTAFEIIIKIYDENIIFHKLLDIANILSISISAINSGFILFQPSIVNIKTSPPTSYTCFKYEWIIADKQSVSVNGNKRPAYRVGWPTVAQTMEWAFLYPKQLNIESSFENLKINILIQNHALNRLQERIDCFERMSIHLFLNNCFRNFNQIKNSKGQWLIEYKLYDIKVGYLVYEYVEGVVLIKTFLLLTNNSTPEGEKLHEQLGIDKIDKQYLQLDKLSSFISSDIPDNPQVMKIFSDAGCAELFDLTPLVTKQNTEQKQNAAQIAEYFELENKVDKEEVLAIL